MTPGVARSREELFWLPYPEHDRVLINAHNFTPAGPTGIGGEVFWICPSLDTAGNGTTTANDLSGNGLNATLVNMDAATDWVADTGAGGVRALDLDGSNDRLAISGAGSNGSLSFSAWVYLRATSQVIVFNFKTTNTVANLLVLTGALGIRGSSTATVSSTTGITTNQWLHVAGTITGTTGTVFVNGTQTATGAVSTVGASTSGFDIGAYSDFGAGFFLNGRIDDLRLFHRVLSGAEITALATMRGYQP